MDPYKIIIQPVMTEQAFEMIETQNKLTFLVSRRANKNQIREAVEVLYEVKVDKVNTIIQKRGKKKAIVRLTPDHDASEVATKLGIY